MASRRSERLDLVFRRIVREHGVLVEIPQRLLIFVQGRSESTGFELAYISSTSSLDFLDSRRSDVFELHGDRQRLVRLLGVNSLFVRGVVLPYVLSSGLVLRFLLVGLLFCDIFFAQNTCRGDSDRLFRLVGISGNALDLSDKTFVGADFTEDDVLSVEMGCGYSGR